ncbi:response regulator transcription factor [Streptomyces sp. NPDC051561]|uniref:response regulator transcription factor n=1 Tax=Streptomyces sp. NPDC051561 TaxID=3365658 RepID=UPI0037AD370F
MSQLFGDGAPAAAPVLTSRQAEILSLVALGHTDHRVGRELVLSIHTVKTHLRRIRSRIGVSPREAMVGVSYRRGLLPLPSLPDGQRPAVPARTLFAMSVRAEGRKIRDAASALGITSSTASGYVWGTLQDLGATDRAHGVHLLYAWRLLPIDSPPSDVGCVGSPTPMADECTACPETGASA